MGCRAASAPRSLALPAVRVGLPPNNSSPVLSACPFRARWSGEPGVSRCFTVTAAHALTWAGAAQNAARRSLPSWDSDCRQRHMRTREERPSPGPEVPSLHGIRRDPGCRNWPEPPGRAQLGWNAYLPGVYGDGVNASNDAAHLADLLRLLNQVDTWSARTSAQARHLETPTSSAMGGDDMRLKPYHISHASWASLSHAGDHLLALRTLLAVACQQHGTTVRGFLHEPITLASDTRFWADPDVRAVHADPWRAGERQHGGVAASSV
jgi:hypothetical protein